MIKTCPVCGKTFDVLNTRRIYCCKKCANAAYSAKLPPRVIAKKICRVCGKEFTATYGNEKYCSVECREKFKYMNKSDIRKYAVKDNECYNCGKTFTKSFFGERFCSDDCRLQYFEKLPGLSYWKCNDQIVHNEDLRC